MCVVSNCCVRIGFCFPWFGRCSFTVCFVIGCVVVVWVVVVVFWVVSVVSVGSLFLARVNLFLGSLVFGVRIFTFFMFGGGFCFRFIRYIGRWAVWRVCRLLIACCCSGWSIFGGFF